MIWIFLRSLEVTCLQQIKQVICFSVWVTKLLQGLLSHELAAYPLDDPIDSGNFCVTVCLPLTQKDSITHIHGLAVYVKEGLPVARSLSPENSVDSHFCFRLALLHAVSYLFFLYRSPSLS